MSSENYEERGDGLKFDLLIMVYSSRVSYCRRDGLVKRSNHLRPICLIQLLLEGAIETWEE